MGTNISITDTGYPNIEKLGDQLDNIANSGSAITLEVNSISIGRNSGNDDRPAIGSFQDVEISKNSSENQTFTISGKIDRTSTNISKMVAMDELVTTQGVKLVSEVSSTDGSYSLVYIFGYANRNDTYHTGSGNELSADTPHLHVVFTSIKFSDDAQNRTTIRWTLDGYITGANIDIA